MILQNHEDTGNREDLEIKPNSCFSDLLDSVESMECVSMSENLNCMCQLFKDMYTFYQGAVILNNCYL